MNRSQINSQAIASSILSNEDLAIIEFVENDDYHDYWFDEEADYEEFCACLDSMLPAQGEVTIRSQVG